MRCPHCHEAELICIHHNDVRGGYSMICGAPFTSCPDTTGRFPTEADARRAAAKQQVSRAIQGTRK